MVHNVGRRRYWLQCLRPKRVTMPSTMCILITNIGIEYLDCWTDMERGHHIDSGFSNITFPLKEPENCDETEIIEIQRVWPVMADLNDGARGLWTEEYEQPPEVPEMGTALLMPWFLAWWNPWCTSQKVHTLTWYRESLGRLSGKKKLRLQLDYSSLNKLITGNH